MKFSKLAILKATAAFFLIEGGRRGGHGGCTTILVGVLAEESPSSTTPRLRLLHPADEAEDQASSRSILVLSGGIASSSSSSSSSDSDNYFSGSNDNEQDEEQQVVLTSSSSRQQGRLVIGRELQATQPTWIQLGADIDGAVSPDLAGSSVDISSDGTVVAVGAPSIGDMSRGNVRVFTYANNVWTQRGATIYEEAADDGFGKSVSLSSDGTVLAVGAPFNDGNGDRSGHVRVYKYADSKWTQRGADIDGGGEFHFFGSSVDLSSDGTVLAALASGEGGHVRVYQFSSNAWIQRGSDIDEETSNDFYYEPDISLSSDGTVLAVGAPENDGKNGKDSGHVRVFKYANSKWTQRGSDIDGAAVEDRFGHSVSLSSDGTIVAVGASEYFSSIPGSGYVRVYKYDTNNAAWAQLGADIYGEAIYDYFGKSVSLSSDGFVLAVGATENAGATTSGIGSGHVRVFKFANNAWTQLGADIDGEAAGDQSGWSVALSSDGFIVAVGARFNDGDSGSATGIGHVRVHQYTGTSTTPSTPKPTNTPTNKPTTNKPTTNKPIQPTRKPTNKPSTRKPTNKPTTRKPTNKPTKKPN